MAASNTNSKWKGFLRHSRKNSVVTAGSTKTPHTSKSSPDCVSRPCKSFTEKYRATQTTLGEGNAGRVFVAVRQADGRPVAVKRFMRRQQHVPEGFYSRQILAEFGIGSRLRHRNICENLELLRDDEGRWYQVMEYAPFNLFDRVLSKKMSPQEIDCTFMQLIAGVSYLHQSGVAHRDIKLENVVFTQSGVMKIIDFGVATTWSEDSGQRRVVNELAGCRPYMAPEMLSRKPYNPQSTDVWSLAILYCCMVLGRFPWQEATPKDQKFAAFAQSSAASTQADLNRNSQTETQTQVYCHNLATEVITEHDWETAQQLSEKGPICIVVEVQPAAQDTDGHLDQRVWEPSRQFSKESWAVVRGMLLLNGERRSTIQQIRKSHWVRNGQMCSTLLDGESCLHSHV